MVGYLEPLAHNFKIVNELGFPTTYFIRWAQQKQLDIGEAVGEERAVEIVKQFLTEHPLQAGSGIDLSPDGDLNNSPTISAKSQEILDQISITQGSVLFRGASGWEALPPGANTQYLKSGGPSADPIWQTPSGGGGGGGKIYGGLSPPSTLVSSSALATKGCCITPLKAFSISEILWQLNTVVGGEYVARILQMNSTSTTVSSVLAAASPITTSTASTGTTLLFEFSTPVDLLPGTSYALVLSRTNGGDTYALPLYGAAASQTLLLGFPANTGIAFTLGKAIPAPGDTNASSTQSPFNLRIGGVNT